MSDKNCSYTFEGENLTALWTAFQQQGKASCPQTGAAISFETMASSKETEPAVQISCAHCGMETRFEPGEHEGFGWAE